MRIIEIIPQLSQGGAERFVVDLCNGLVMKGHEVTLTFDGADEDAAYEAISKFMQENL